MDQMPLASTSAVSQTVAADLGVARSTLMSWVRAAGQLPAPTWGEIHRLRAENALLKSEVQQLRALKDNGEVL